MRLIEALASIGVAAVMLSGIAFAFGLALALVAAPLCFVWNYFYGA